MKKVLILIDFSAAAKKAANFAISMLNDTVVEFTFMNAYGYVTAPNENVSLINEAFRKASESQLSDFVADLHLLPHHKSVQESLPLFPEQAAEYLNEKQHFDLVVLGRDDKASRPLFGSVATQLVRTLPTNVLIIPGSASINPINKMVLGVDYKEMEDLDVFGMLKHIASRKNAEITLLSIQYPHQKPDSFVKYQLHDSFKDHKTFDYTIKEEDVEEGFEEYLETHKVDLFALVSRHHSFLDVVFGNSLTRKIASHTQVPLLCIHDKTTSNVMHEEASSMEHH